MSEPPPDVLDTAAQAGFAAYLQRNGYNPRLAEMFRPEHYAAVYAMDGARAVWDLAVEEGRRLERESDIQKLVRERFGGRPHPGAG